MKWHAVIYLIFFLFLAACANESDSRVTVNDSANTRHDIHEMAGDTSAAEAVGDDVLSVSPSFREVNPGIALSIKEIVDHYLQLKNDLVAENAGTAAKSAHAMGEDMRKLDTALFSRDQLRVYNRIEKELREHADHISKNANDIVHQREHFSMMSLNIHALVAAFGAGRSLYFDYCPMYNNNEGAMWLSEVKEIKNPYFGSKMLNCGEVKKVIRSQ